MKSTEAADNIHCAGIFAARLDRTDIIGRVDGLVVIVVGETIVLTAATTFNHARSNFMTGTDLKKRDLRNFQRFKVQNTQRLSRDSIYCK